MPYVESVRSAYSSQGGGCSLIGKGGMKEERPVDAGSSCEASWRTGISGESAVLYARSFISNCLTLLGIPDLFTHPTTPRIYSIFQALLPRYSPHSSVVELNRQDRTTEPISTLA